MSHERSWDGLQSRDNSLNFIRLALALVVAVAHANILGYGLSPLIPGMHERAVEGFFVVSGYLIAASRGRLSLGLYLWHRALRIYPGLWVNLILTAFVIVPLVLVLRGHSWQVEDQAAYVWTNFSTLIGQWGIAGTPADVPYPGVWNGSLWSLAYEVGCYLVFGILLSFRRHAGGIAIGVLIVATCFNLFRPPVIDLFVVQQSVRLGGFFAAGALIFHVRHRVPRSGVIAFSAAVAVVMTWWLGDAYFWTSAPLPFAYLLMWLGVRLPVRIGARNDLSYGMYVYAFPVTQALVSLRVAAAVDPWLFAVGCVAGTTPLAWLSWCWVEKPAMRLRAWTPQRIFTWAPSRVRRVRGERRGQRVEAE